MTAPDLHHLRSVEFRVSQTPSLTNLLQGRTAMAQRARYRKLRSAYELELLTGPKSWRFWPHDRRRYVVFTRFARAIQMDDDGLIGGMKPLRDSLHLRGVCLDDARKYSDYEYHQDRGPKGVLVQVYLLEEPCEPSEAVLRRWCETLGRGMP